jgi:asparagine synthetase B (glutamine-hydrolysing)
VTSPCHTEGFGEVFAKSVADRLPGGPVAVHLSGGMDSTAIAAIAAEVGSRDRITGYCISAAGVLPEDEEERYARLAASHLGIDLVVQDLARYAPHAPMDEPALWTPAPQAYPFMAAHRDLLRQMEGAGAHVVLGGQGGDAAMSAFTGRAAMLLRDKRFGTLASEIIDHARHTRSLRGSGLRHAFGRRRARTVWTPPLPAWIDASFASRVGLHDRWQAAWTRYGDDGGAQLQLTHPWVGRSSEGPEALKLPVMVSYPFFDKRVVEYLAGVPNYMRAGKRILRESMRTRLPEAILARPKTPLPGDLVHAMVAGGKISSGVSNGWGAYPGMVDGTAHLQALRDYSDGGCPESTWSSDLLFAPVALMNWLRIREIHERSERCQQDGRNERSVPA